MVVKVNEKNEEYIDHLQANLTSTPRDVIAMAIEQKLQRRKRLTTGDHAEAAIDRKVEKYASQYFLRLCGHNEYLIDERPLWQYRIVTDLVLSSLPITVEVVVKKTILYSLIPTVLDIPSYTPPMPNNDNFVSLWRMNFFLRFKFNSLTCVTFSLDTDLRFLIAAQVFCFHDPISSISFTR